ncbi:MAG TPA: FGGY family carbohydrate kinase, partial [Burkholderiales bacterium]
MSLVLAIDQGTHASRALVVDEAGRAVARGVREIALVHPRPDWAEQDGEEIVASIFDAVAQALRSLGARSAEVSCAGLASQRSNAVCWDRVTGRALSPVFSWQDRRAHAWIASL